MAERVSSLPPPLASLDPGPRIAQRHSAVEDQGARTRVSIHAEIPLALKLVATASCGPRQTGLNLARRQRFQGLRIQRRGEVTVLDGSGVGLQKEMVV